MNLQLDSASFKGASTIMGYGDSYFPFEFTGPRDEYLACRETAWLGVTLNCSPVYDVYGSDVDKFMTYICVNKDYSTMKIGGSKHALICNEQGKMLADGVASKMDDNYFRTYWLAPVLQYYVETSELDVQGKYRTDEYFLQIDGPKSLEIIEKACQCDLHDLKFSQHKTVQICGTNITVHRLGMSGALAYEVHGEGANFETAYSRIRSIVEEFGGKMQGMRNYGIVNHTPAGYPNQSHTYVYPVFSSDPGLAEFAQKAIKRRSFSGSASDNDENFYLTPYDVGWGYLVNFDHNFMGKDALLEISKNPPRKMVTLEWNTEDVGDVFMSQFRGQNVEFYEPIEYHTSISDASQSHATRGDYVLMNGKTIGVATGKTYAYYERRMISLASIDKEFTKEGTELIVLWGSPSYPQKEIRAKVARFPYYNGEYRNETFDTEKIPHPIFEYIK